MKSLQSWKRNIIHKCKRVILVYFLNSAFLPQTTLVSSQLGTHSLMVKYLVRSASKRKKKIFFFPQSNQSSRQILILWIALWGTISNWSYKTLILSDMFCWHRLSYKRKSVLMNSVISFIDLSIRKIILRVHEICYLFRRQERLQCL